MEQPMKDAKDKTGYLFPEHNLRAYKEPVLISACFLGIPCRWHGRRSKSVKTLSNSLFFKCNGSRKYMRIFYNSCMCLWNISNMMVRRINER